MKLCRFVIILMISIINFNDINNRIECKSIVKNDILENTTHNCPFTRIIEDIFKINKTTSVSKRDSDQTKLFLDSVDSFDRKNPSINKTDEELINTIIASIKRIKDNITKESNEGMLNEAIVLNNDINIKNVTNMKIGNIKSGVEERNDISKNKTYIKAQTTKQTNNSNKINTEKIVNNTNYVEVLTIEPNNTMANNKTSHILDALKYIMPLFNTTRAQDLHSITIIEKKQDKNQSIIESKNISTIVVKYCNKENATRKDEFDVKDDLKPIFNTSTVDVDYLDEEYDKDVPRSNLSKTTREVLEAAEYGIQKMHELYGVLEPKLYYMGLSLNEKDPARYVAAFNAPSEEASRYSRYGYASIQAAARLKELMRYGHTVHLVSHAHD